MDVSGSKDSHGARLAATPFKVTSVSFFVFTTGISFCLSLGDKRGVGLEHELCARAGEGLVHFFVD